MEVCVEQELNGKIQALNTHLRVLQMIIVCLQLTRLNVYFKHDSAFTAAHIVLVYINTF